MIEKDTIKLLRECDEGVKMGIASRWASKNIRVSISSSRIGVSSLPQFDRDMDGVAVSFSQTLSNRF